VGPRLDDLRCPRIPKYRRHAGGRGSHRHHRLDPREPSVQAARGLHRRTFGGDDMRAFTDRSRSLRRAALSLLLAAAVYDGLARSGAFPSALLPTLPTVVQALIDGLLDGSLAAHTIYTLYRVLFGMGLAIAVGLPLGMLMGR